MFTYILRRLLLLPLTLFFILLINFIIINLAPGDPVSYVEISGDGASLQANRSLDTKNNERYLQFREFYGLTLPILFNTWPFLSKSEIKASLSALISRKWPKQQQEMSAKEYQQLLTTTGDQARFVMTKLLAILNTTQEPLKLKQAALKLYIRGTMRLGFTGSKLTTAQRTWNKKVTENDQLMRSLSGQKNETEAELAKKIELINAWHEKNLQLYELDLTKSEKIAAFFSQTRFVKYIGRIAHLDFGTLRNDPNKTVIEEVSKRLKYSLTLIFPMLFTFFVCQFFGLTMAHYQSRWPDYLLNLLFLFLYSIPIFVMAPFLIEKLALHHFFPFTKTAFPISGFTSPTELYEQKNSYQRAVDIFQHLALPILTIIYGSLAVQSRLSRTAFLEVLRQDYVRTAKAKGLTPFLVYFKHVLRNSSVTIVSSLASSLGTILSGALFVEVLFDIDGFGKFFYEGVLNRDYNVIMFSALAGSFLTLLGYFLADLAYMWLDPRITLE